MSDEKPLPEENGSPRGGVCSALCGVVVEHQQLQVVERQREHLPTLQDLPCHSANAAGISPNIFEMREMVM
jgi:hypothetical protein